MRKFRAIVQTPIEPQDKEVLWYWKGELLYWNNYCWEPFHTKFRAEEVFFENGDNLEDILRKLLAMICCNSKRISENSEKIERNYKRIVNNNWKIENILAVIESDNILSNSFFIDGTLNWDSEPLQLLRLNSKYLIANKRFLSKQRTKIAFSYEDDVPILTINGALSPCTFIQPFTSLNLGAVDPDIEFPFYVTLSFQCRALSEGDITISTVDYTDGSVEQKKVLPVKPVEEDAKWKTCKTTFVLERNKGIGISFNADVQIKGLYMKLNEARTLHLLPESLNVKQ